jgi:hypothetical protein
MFRFMPSLADVAFVLPILLLFSGMQGVRTLLGDGDTGWHIRAGEWMLSHRQVPRTDIFSFTKPGEPWFAWEWLWDVAFGWLHLHWGMAAVIAGSMLVLCATFLLLYRLLNQRCGHPFVAIAVTVLAIFGTTVHWLARPHLFTFLFLVLFLTLLEGVRKGDAKKLFWLPLLTVLWTNLHGGFVTGIILLGLYAAGELISAAASTDARQRQGALAKALRYAATAVACLGASLINPYGFQLHAHIWTYFRDPVMTKDIGEFQGTNFQALGSGYFEIMLVLAAGAAVWYFRQRRFAEILTILAWAHAGLLMVRNYPLFVLIAAPFVAEALTESLRALSRAPAAAWLRNAAQTLDGIGAEIAPVENIGRVHAVCALVFVGFVLGVTAPDKAPSMEKKWVAGYDPKVYPERALSLLTDASMRIYTHDEWGDYLIYKLFPSGIRVFVDGRSDFYGNHVNEYMNLLRANYNWSEILSCRRIDTVLLPPDNPLATAIKESRNWRAVYDDGTAIVFRRVGDSTPSEAACAAQPASASSLAQLHGGRP